MPRFFGSDFGFFLSAVNDASSEAFTLFEEGWRPVSVKGILRSYDAAEISEAEARLWAEEEGDRLDNIPFKSSGDKAC